MKNIKEILREFNVKGYADPNSKYIDNGKGGKSLVLRIDNFMYEDEFYGGEPYSGNETIWENEKPIFRCVYWGKVVKGVEFSEIYNFLRKALNLGYSDNLVCRGPKEYIEGNLKYTNEIENNGTIEEFKQTERIFMNDREVYIAHFFGGLVNQQKE